MLSSRGSFADIADARAFAQKSRDELLPERKNFLSYSYVLYKLCELEGLDEFKHCFSLLKGRDKLFRQDSCWRLICTELGWQYLPSI